MFGLGFDLTVTGFKFIKLNLFHRNNPDREDNSWQIYAAWNYQTQFINRTLTIEGFFDLFGDEGGNTVSHQLLVPRFLVDISDIFGASTGSVHAGIEWQYWHNKFGVDGVTESVPQLQLKWIFL